MAVAHQSIFARMTNLMFSLKKCFNKISGLCASVPAAKVNKAEASDAQPPMDATLMDAVLSGWFHQETDELFEGFKISAEDIVLDVGCGDSPFLHFCALRGAAVIFADVDATKVETMSKMLTGTPARSITPLVCDACALPLPDASASKIVAMEVMEHVEDPIQFLKELVRVGKPGAQYLITVPDPVAETLQKNLAPPVYFEKPNHIRIIDRPMFENLVTQAGLIVESKKYYGFYWSMWWIFFWSCKQDLGAPPHPLLESWTQTWKLLLETPQGPEIKKVLDAFMPKSQAIIARKPVSA